VSYVLASYSPMADACSLCFKVCATHGHVSPLSEHACLRNTFYVDLLAQLVSRQAMIEAGKLDVSLDGYHKLSDISLTAVDIATESTGEDADRLRADLLPLLLKVLGLVLAGVSEM